MDEDTKTYTIIINTNNYFQNQYEEAAFDSMEKHYSIMSDLGFKLKSMSFTCKTYSCIPRIAGNILRRTEENSHSIRIDIFNSELFIYSEGFECLEAFKWGVEGAGNLYPIEDVKVEYSIVKPKIKTNKSNKEFKRSKKFIRNVLLQSGYLQTKGEV